MKIVSYFSGAGGLDLGFALAGHEIIWSNDFDDKAVESYNFNIGKYMNHQSLLADIVNLLNTSKENINSILPDCDVIIGYIANDRMYQVLTDFFEKRITDTALINSLSALKLGKQYVAITQKACDQITITSERALSRLELMILKDRSVVRRREGVSLAEKVVMEHRRDGRFFDEILNGGSI